MASRILTRPAIRQGSIKEYFGGDPALKGCWSLNGHARDESGNANHGTVNGALPYIGRFGNSYRFNGTSWYINIGAIGSVGIANPYVNLSGTVGAWTTNNYIDTGVVYSEQDSTPSATFILAMGNFWIHNGTSFDNVAASPFLLLNTYIFQVVTWGNGVMRIYINGEQRGSGTYLGTTKTFKTPLIGAYYSQGALSAWYTGLLNEIFILKRALSPAEISQYYQWAIATPRKYWLYSPEVAPPAGNLLVHPGYDGGYRKHRGGYR